MGRNRRFLSFLAITIAMFMGMLDGTILNIALPDITRSLHATLVDASWITTVYVMGLAVFMIPAAKLADLFGRKKLMVIGLVLFGASSALCGLSHSLGMLVAFRAVQSLGGAIILPIVVPMGLEIFGKDKLRTVGSAVGAVTALAAAGGPPIGGVLLKISTWQSIFFVNVPFAILALALVLTCIDESYDRTVERRMDWAGLVLLTSALFLLTFALLKGNDYGWNSALILGMFGGAFVAAVLFVLAERRITYPMVDFHLFRERTFTASVVASLVAGFGVASPLLVFSFFLQNARGFEPFKAALVIMAMALTVIVSMPLGSFLSSRYDANVVNFLGLLLMSGGAFALSLLRMDSSVAYMVGSMVLCGFGLGFAMQAILSSVKHIPLEKSGIGSGIVNAARQVGICLGVALLVSLLTLHAASATTAFRNDSLAAVAASDLADPLKQAISADLAAVKASDATTGTGDSDLSARLEADVKAALASLATAPRPADDSLAKLYDAAAALQTGSAKALDGQKSLAEGLSKLESGLSALRDGGSALASKVAELEDGIVRSAGGAKTLDAESAKGARDLSAGIASLVGGLQTLVVQLDPGADPTDPTLDDGVRDTDAGASALSSNLSSFVAANDATLFAMIRANPAASQLLAGYRTSLQQAAAAYQAATDPATRAALLAQVQGLQNLVNLYAAGTDPTVTDAAGFTADLLVLAQQSASGQSLVSSAHALSQGAGDLSAGTSRLAALFAPDGTFRVGLLELQAGAETLRAKSAGIGDLSTGIADLDAALAQISDGSAKLEAGAGTLRDGIASAATASSALSSGSSDLALAQQKIADGAAQLAEGVALVGQKAELVSVLDAIAADKDAKIAGAFDDTFRIAAIALALLAFVGLFTDRREKAGEKV